MLTVEADAGLVERRLMAGDLSCPDCAGRLAPWGWAVERLLRGHGMLTEPIQPRRSRCRACRATHVLLPVVAVLRRADLAEVIGTALAAKAVAFGDVFGRRERGSNAASPSTRYRATSLDTQPLETA